MSILFMTLLSGVSITLMNFILTNLVSNVDFADVFLTNGGEGIISHHKANNLFIIQIFSLVSFQIQILICPPPSTTTICNIFSSLGSHCHVSDPIVTLGREFYLLQPFFRDSFPCEEGLFYLSLSSVNILMPQGESNSNINNNHMIKCLLEAVI